MPPISPASCLQYFIGQIQVNEVNNSWQGRDKFVLHMTTWEEREGCDGLWTEAAAMGKLDLFG